MTRIKVCGLCDGRDLDLALSSGVDAVGFVVEIAGSRHRLSAEEAASLIVSVPVFVQSVAVIQPPSVHDALSLAELTGADVLQVQGSLGPLEMAALRSQVSAKVIAAVDPAYPQATDFASCADALLVDTLHAGMLGGSGRVHDWQASARLARQIPIPLILAGGLNVGNVAAAVRAVRPYAVDVSSGVEQDGRKDPKLVREFVEAVRLCR